MTLTFGSLFAGIGGMDLGLERAGMKCRWQVEINPFCQRVLAKHWPTVARHSDVREVGAHNLERVDVICGGFPCQDISNAGKRAGIDGERSGLWSQYARIICELRPRFVFVENVAALLARGLGRVLGDLAASGYDAEWDCIPAAAVGAPHRRDRLFLVAYPDSQSRGQQPLVFPWGGDPAVAGSDGADGNVAHAKSKRRRARRARGLVGDGEGTPAARLPLADADRERLARGRIPEGRGRPTLSDADGSGPRFVGRSIRPSEWWAVEPDVGRVAHGIPPPVDELSGLGNAVVPQVAELIGRRILEVAR